jgi:hypothetical protein
MTTHTGPATGLNGLQPVEAPKTPSARSILDVIGLVIAPSALVTALAFFFGWTETNARAQHFGIDPSTLDYSTRDYLLRSADALYVPLGAVVIAALSALGAHALISAVLRNRSPLVARAASSSIALVGAMLLGFGIWAVFRSPLFGTFFLFPSLAPGVGAILLGYAIHRLRGRLQPVALTAFASLVVLSAFWTSAVYADALGRGRAEQLARSLSHQPGVIVYSKRPLGLRPPVITTPLDQRNSGYAFRYSGLRLLVHSGAKYFLVPDTWNPDAVTNPGARVAIVLPEAEDVRFEFLKGQGR